LLAVSAASVVLRLAVSGSFKGHSYVAPEPVKPQPEAVYLKKGEIDLGDSEQYLLLASGIRHRLSYTWNHEPNTFRTPGYPLLLALLDNNVAAIVVVQALLAGLTVFLVGLIGHRVFEFRVGLLAASLFAVDVPGVFLAGMVMSETLFAFAVVLAVALLDCPKALGAGRSALGGLVLGFAVLVRPVAVPAFVPLAILLAVRRNWRGLAVMLAGFALLPAAWSCRNYLHYQRFSLTSNGGYNLLYANAAAVVSELEREPGDSSRVNLAHDFTSRLATDNPLELSDRMTREAVRIILFHPLRYVWICVRGVPKIVAGIKADDLVLRTRSETVTPSQGSVLLSRMPRAMPAVWLLAGFELLLSLGALVLALASLGFRRWRGAKFVMVGLAACFLLVALPFTDGRFRLPMMPFLYLAASSVLFARQRSAAA
jgi:hypothetical protein